MPSAPQVLTPSPSASKGSSATPLQSLSMPSQTSGLPGKAAGSLSWMILSLAPDPAFPAGTLVPGFGMNGPGELLVSLHPFDVIDPIRPGATWDGPGHPVPFTIPMPKRPALMGICLYAQGALIDLTAPAGTRVGLTEAVELAIGE